MKKLTVAVALLAASFGAQAQDYKPVAGNAVVELGLAGGLIATSPTLSTSGFGAPQIKVRYFLADQLAARVGFNWSQTTLTDRAYGANDEEGTQKIKNSLFGLSLGVEKHFAGTERLSTYVGADLLLQFTGASETRENWNGGAYVADFKQTYKGTNTNGDNASMGFGLRAVTGADYYFVEKVYLGAELGWGFLANKDGKTSVETTTGGTTTTTEAASPGGSFELTPAISGAVRLGFRF